MAVVPEITRPFVCEKTGLAVICHSCRICEVSAQQLCLYAILAHQTNPQVELHMASCGQWFGNLPTAGQRRFLFQLVDVSPANFVRYAMQLLEPFSYRDTMYALSNVKGITDGAKAEVMLSTLHHRSNHNPGSKTSAHPAVTPSSARPRLRGKSSNNPRKSSPPRQRRNSHAALTATITRRMAQPGLQVGKPRTYAPGAAHTGPLADKLTWFENTTHWCRLSAFRHLLQHCGVDLLQPLYAHAQKVMGIRGPSLGDERCDIIRLLPPPLAKYLLGFLEFRDLQQAVLVSPQWASVTKQVMQDQTHRRDADDMILDLQKNHAHKQRPHMVFVDVGCLPHELVGRLACLPAFYLTVVGLFR